MSEKYLIEKAFDPNAAGDYAAVLDPLEGYSEEPVLSLPGTFVVGAEMSDDVALRIARDRLNGTRPHILAISRDYTAKTPDPPEVLPAAAERLTFAQVVQLVGADKAHAAGARGQGRRIAIVDTGYSEETRQELGRRIVAAESFIPGEPSALNPEDSHGDWCIQMIAAICPDAEIVVIKGLSYESGSGSYSGIAKGCQRARDLRSTAINLSLGGPKSLVINDALDALDLAGLLIGAAAGNEQRGKSSFVADTTSPASALRVVTVGAAQSDLLISDFSNHGVCLDISAPGVYVNAPNVSGYWSGTSMATPILVACAELVASSGRSKDQAKQLLYSTANDTLVPAHKEGNGFVNLEGIFADTTPEEPTPEPMKTISRWRYSRTPPSQLDRELQITFRGEPIHVATPVAPYPFGK